MKRFKLKKLNNEGAALILAMVIILFITILTSLLLYVTGINYEMKTTDYRTKVSFYGAETPLEELRVQLAVDVSDAAKKAYREMMNEFSDYNTEAVKKDRFEEKFFENIEEIWESRGVTDMRDAQLWKAAISSILTNTNYDVYVEGEVQAAGKPYHIEIQPFDLLNGVQGTTLERDDVNERILLLRVKVYYTEDDFLSVISTDFAMDVPKIDWSVSSSDITTPGITAEDATRQDIDFEQCVSYLSWEKQ